MNLLCLNKDRAGKIQWAEGYQIEIGHQMDLKKRGLIVPNVPPVAAKKLLENSAVWEKYHGPVAVGHMPGIRSKHHPMIQLQVAPAFTPASESLVPASQAVLEGLPPEALAQVATAFEISIETPPEQLVAAILGAADLQLAAQLEKIVAQIGQDLADAAVEEEQPEEEAEKSVEEPVEEIKAALEKPNGKPAKNRKAPKNGKEKGKGKGRTSKTAAPAAPPPPPAVTVPGPVSTADDI